MDIELKYQQYHFLVSKFSACPILKKYILSPTCTRFYIKPSEILYVDVILGIVQPQVWYGTYRRGASFFSGLEDFLDASPPEIQMSLLFYLDLFPTRTGTVGAEYIESLQCPENK